MSRKRVELRGGRSARASAATWDRLEDRRTVGTAATKPPIDFAMRNLPRQAKPHHWRNSPDCCISVTPIVARRGMLVRAWGAARMFDVYLTDRRDHLLVVEKGQQIPIDQHLGRWHKKRAAVAVIDEIKRAVQRDGYYSRRLRQPHGGRYGANT